jgi:hypothetical protein
MNASKGEGWNDLFLELDPERGIVERPLNAAAARCEAVLILISRVRLNSRWCEKATAPRRSLFRPIVYELRNRFSNPLKCRCKCRPRAGPLLPCNRRQKSAP